jgi:hypothetical protein
VYFASRSADCAIKHITKLFDHYSAKVDVMMRDCRSSSDYQELEKVLQSQEAEIRNHIRV